MHLHAIFGIYSHFFTHPLKFMVYLKKWWLLWCRAHSKMSLENINLIWMLLFVKQGILLNYINNVNGSVLKRKFNHYSWLFESSVLSTAPTLASQSHSFLSLSLSASITIKWETTVAFFYLSNCISTYWCGEYVEAPTECSLILNNMAGNNVTVFQFNFIVTNLRFD